METFWSLFWRCIPGALSILQQEIDGTLTKLHGKKMMLGNSLRQKSGKGNMINHPINLTASWFCIVSVYAKTTCWMMHHVQFNHVISEVMWT